MTTLIQTGGAIGERRCDAKCYEAECVECDCICGGVNHGKGLEKALKSSVQFFNEIVDRGGVLPDWLLIDTVQDRLF